MVSTTSLNCKDTWNIFDGRYYHETLSFTGERYALVFFTTEFASARTRVRDRGWLRAMGFQF